MNSKASLVCATPFQPGQPIAPWAGTPAQGSAIWLVRMPELVAALDDRARATLSAAERDRGLAIADDAARETYFAIRAFVRHALGALLARPPGEVAFVFGPQGKPELSGAPVDLRFNLSHAGDLAALAVTEGASIGVDLERVREVQRFQRIADRFFSESEKQALGALEGEARALLFMRLWTAREAIVKATGEGVWAAFERIQLGVGSIGGGKASLRAMVPSGVRLGEVAAPDGYVGAVALLA